MVNTVNCVRPCWSVSAPPGFSTAALEEETMSRKNVLFIVVDDLRPQLGCYGMDWIHSPNIDALAAESLLFERAYCQQAVCAPSRCSVLSGCRPDTTGIYDLQTPLRKNMPEVLSLPEYFRNHGYETVSIGKVYHHPQDDLQGWSVPPFQSTGDWKGRGYLTDEALEASKIRDREMIERGDSRRGLGPAFEAADVRDEDYHDGADTQAAIAELKRLAGLDRPFFLGMGFHKPHLPFNAPKRYWDMYDPEKLPLADNPFAPEGATEFSLVDFGELRGYFSIPESGDIPERHQAYDWKGFRYLQLTFRELTRPLKIHAAGATFTSYPVEPEGRFECNDQEMTRIWQVGAYTQQLCSHDRLMDGLPLARATRVARGRARAIAGASKRVRRAPVDRELCAQLRRVAEPGRTAAGCIV